MTKVIIHQDGGVELALPGVPERRERAGTPDVPMRAAHRAGR